MYMHIFIGVYIPLLFLAIDEAKWHRLGGVCHCKRRASAYQMVPADSIDNVQLPETSFGLGPLEPEALRCCHQHLQSSMYVH